MKNQRQQTDDGSRKVIAYVGYYMDSHLRNERGLPAWNPAGSNRMVRLCQAIREAGGRAYILTPASAMSMKWKKTLLHPAKVLHRDGVPILCLPACGIPWTSFLGDGFAIMWGLRRLRRKHKVSGVMIYNTSFVCLVAALVARHFLRVPVVLDMEDVPAFQEQEKYSAQAIYKRLQQGLLIYARSHILRMVESVVIPTKRFERHIPVGIHAEVVTGCLRVPSRDSAARQDISRRLRILFGGKLSEEHGIHLLLEAMQQIDKLSNATDFQFDICGQGDKTTDVSQAVRALQNAHGLFHGYAEDHHYKMLLEQADVCLALQNPRGFNAENKTPSKGYEAMAHGKLLVVSNVGDFSELPQGTCLVLREYSAQSLAYLLCNITASAASRIGEDAYAHARVNWHPAIVGQRLLGLFT